MTLNHRMFASPVGDLTLVASDAGLVAILWQDDDPARVRLGSRVRDILLAARAGDAKALAVAEGRRLLGHKNIETTIQFYDGLQTDNAYAVYDTLIGKMRADATAPPPPKPRSGTDGFDEGDLL